MALESLVVTALTDYAGLTNLIGDELHPNRLPQNPSYPNTVYSVVRNKQNTLGGESDIKNEVYEYNVRAETYAEVDAVATQINNAMTQVTNPFKALCILDDDVYPEDLLNTEGVFRRIMRFSVWK